MMVSYQALAWLTLQLPNRATPRPVAEMGKEFGSAAHPAPQSISALYLTERQRALKGGLIGFVLGAVLAALAARR